MTGARAIIKLNGDVVAMASGISITHENRLEEIPQLDSLEVAEYAENGHRVSFSISIFKLLQDEDGNNLYARNLKGGSDKSLIGANASNFYLDPLDIRDLLTQPELLVEVMDEISGTPVYTITGAKFEGGTGSVDARGVWTGTWNFKGRRGRGL